MTDTVERFSNRVENYVKYRPDYPREIIPFLIDNYGLTRDSVIADIGCGTGISSRMFLENGNRVIGVEPNAAMRDAANRSLTGFPFFRIVEGTAERTTLPDASVDLVVAAQAFHWFDRDSTRTEFQRILKQGGAVVLIWNERQLDSTPFLREYEAFLVKFSRDYQSVRHDRIDAGVIAETFGKNVRSETFEYIQEFDFEGIKGRMLSSSYMPSEADPIYESMTKDLLALFAKHAENGKIRVFYDTNLFCSQA